MRRGKKREKCRESTQRGMQGEHTKAEREGEEGREGGGQRERGRSRERERGSERGSHRERGGGGGGEGKGGRGRKTESAPLRHFAHLLGELGVYWRRQHLLNNSEDVIVAVDASVEIRQRNDFAAK